MAAIHMAVFILDELKGYVRGSCQTFLSQLHSHADDHRTIDSQSGHVATGIGNVVGNKGGVGVGLLLGEDTSFLFVNSHFTGIYIPDRLPTIGAHHNGSHSPPKESCRAQQ